MAAIMILAVAIIPMVSMFDAGLRAAVVGSNYDRARAIAGEELEEIKALPFRTDPNPPVDSAVELFRPSNGPSPPAGGDTACSEPIEAGFDCRVRTTYLNSNTLAADGAARSMMEVRVTVSWDGGSKSYTTTGIVSRGTR
jgi:hypothetical protein